MNLRRAVAVIFALVALLPLLAVLPALQQSGALTTTQGQMGLLGALLLAVLGFVVLRQVIGQVARLAGALTEAEAGAGAPVAAAIAAPVPGLGQVTEIGQIGGAFARVLVELAARIPEMQDLLNLVLERTMNTVRAPSGSIMLVDPERRALRVVAARGELADLAPGTEVAMGQGVAGRVAGTGEAVGGGERVCLP